MRGEAAALLDPLAVQLGQSVVAYEFRRRGKLMADFEFEQAPALLRETMAKLGWEPD